MSENSIEFSLSNSEQRDSWLNSSHRTLDADKMVYFIPTTEKTMAEGLARLFRDNV